MTRFPTTLALIMVFVGCASSQPDLSGPDQLTRDRLGVPVTYVEGPVTPSPIDSAVRGLLARELSVDDAIRIGLLKNMELQALYEDIGVAEANLVEATLPQNPTLQVDVLQPDQSPRGTALEIEFTQDLLGFFTIPARRAVAQAQLEQTRTLVTGEVIELAARIRGAFYTLQGAQQTRDVLTRVVDTAAASLEYAQALHRVGNLSDLELANQRAQLEEAEVERARIELEVIDAREGLNELMGLWGAETEWSIASRLPELPADDLSLERLESLAIAQRFDIEAARLETETLARSLDLQQTFRWTPGLAIGGEVDRDNDGTWLFGPHIELTLPVFNHGQADTARLLAQVRQAEKRYAALAVNVRADVRRLQGRLISMARLTRRYRDGLLPARRDVVQHSLEQYNFMLIGTFDLLVAKQEEVAAEREYVESLEQYWITRSELARVLGGRLPEGTALDAPSSPADQAPSSTGDGAPRAPGGHQGH